MNTKLGIINHLVRRMNKFYLILLWALPLKSFCQSENHPDSIWKKCVLLYQQGQLDSINITITHFRDYSDIIDPVKQFYIRTDTIYYKDGFYAIGHSIIDYCSYYNRRRTGIWTYYYPSTKRYARGEFSIGAWTQCQVGGPNPVGYAYKTGYWNYWFESGAPMASGIYESVREGFKTSCSSDTMVRALITPNWTFYDSSGRKLPFQPDLAKKINQGN